MGYPYRAFECFQSGYASMTREELLEHVVAMERQESELRARVTMLTATVAQQSDIINQSQSYGGVLVIHTISTLQSLLQ